MVSVGDVLGFILYFSAVVAVLLLIYKKVKTDAEERDIDHPNRWAWASVISPYVVLPIYLSLRDRLSESTGDGRWKTVRRSLRNLAPIILLFLAIPLVMGFAFFRGSLLLGVIVALLLFGIAFWIGTK
jgi:hypothetical protein